MTHVRLGRTLLAFAATALIASHAAAQSMPGSYDPTWGQGGRLFVDLGAPLGFELVGSARQPDGKLVIGGNAPLTEQCGGIAFARFELDGTLDATFGTGGWYKVTPASYCSGPTTLQAMAAPQYGAEVGFVGRANGGLLTGLLLTSQPATAYLNIDPSITTFTARAMAAYSYAYVVAGSDTREPAGTPGRATAFIRIAGGNYVDYNFGTNGVLRRPTGTESDEATAVFLDGDGSIYFAGNTRTTGSGTGTDMVVGKILSSGALDTSWGSGGTVVVDFFNQDDAALTMARDWSGTLLIGGSASWFGGRLPALVQVRGDGALDFAFGNGSGKRTPFLPGELDGEFTALQGPGITWMAAGTATDRTTGAKSLLVHRFDSQGNGTSAFGNQGLVLVGGQANARGFFSADPYMENVSVAGSDAAGGVATLNRFGYWGADSAFGTRVFSLAGATGTMDEGGAMAMRPDGSMVLVGQARVSGRYETLGGVVKLDASGARDTSFGVLDGVAYLVPPAGTGAFFPRAVGLHDDGRVIVASTGVLNYEIATWVTRLTPAGTRDPQWNGGQDATLTGAATFVEVGAVVAQPDGAVLASGTGLNESMTVARFLANGSLDSGFGVGGMVVIGMPSGHDSGGGMLLEADGRILVAGRLGAPARVAVVRLLPNGALDNSWGVGGVAYGPEGGGNAVARQADGKILAAGDCGASADSACIVRFGVDGSVDTTFGTNGVARVPGYFSYIGVAVQPDGKIVAGGEGYAFMLSRFRADGTPDLSFSGGSLNSIESSQARSFAMTADGRLAIAGRAFWNGDLAVARHLGGGGDESPDAFAFPPVQGVAPGTLVTSIAVTPTGYDTQSPVSVSNGEVSIGDCQSWNPYPLVINPGQALCVRHASAAQPGTSVTSTVMIGGTSATFTSTTGELETTLTTVPSSPAALPVRFWFTSNAPAATFECRLDGSSFAPCPSPITIQGIAEGAHTFEVRAVSGGVADSTPASATFTVDATAPDTTITAAPPASTAAALVSFAFASDDPAATFECSIAGMEFFACVSPKEMGVGEGTWTFVVRAVDAAGNRDASPAFRTFTIDRTPPDTTVVSGPSGLEGSADASFMYASNDSGATFECRLDGAPFAACAASSSYSGLAQGAHVFEVRAVDAAGNVDPTPATRSWTVDTVAPDTRLLSAPSGTVASTSATLVFDSPDGGSFFMCSLDGAAFASCPSPVNLTGLAQGSHTFRVYVSDGAGNVDPTPAIATWIVDTAAPDTLITSAPTGTVASSNATIVFTSEAGATFECRIDGGSFAACASPQSLADLSQGAHTFEVRARDAIGNTDSTPATATWTIDTLAPQTTITSAPSGTLVSTSATLVFSADDPAATFQCQLDGGAYAACTSPVSLTGLAEGGHTFAVRALDAAGNADASAATAAWTVDTTAADAFITSAPSGAVASTSATIAFTSEAGAAFECSLDAGAYGTCASPVTLNGLAQGSHTFRVRARDAWGNVDATPATATWIVDTVAPDTAITGGPSGNNQPTTVTFTFSATEAGSTFECRLDGGAFVACASGVTYTVAKGQHTLDVRARDAAANVDATPATRTWRSN